MSTVEQVLDLPRTVGRVSERVLTLQQAADELGVHYMTAYRYVRLGQLDAHKVGGGWRVTGDALDAFQTARCDDAPARASRAPWSTRLESRLLAGDAPGAWGVLEASMASGMAVGDVYQEMLVPALHSIGDRWAAGEIEVAVEHRASAIVTRLVGRLGARCLRRGRSRGGVVLGAPAGEHHSIVVAILGDLLRLEGWEVLDLGADTPAESFVFAAAESDDLVAVGISVTNPDNLTAAADACLALQRADLGVPVLVGGQAVRDDDHARALGADAFARDVASTIELLNGAHASRAGATPLG